MTDPFDDREINKRIAEFMGWSDLKWRDAGTDVVSYWPAGWYGDTSFGKGCLAADYAKSMDDLIPVIEKLRAGEKYLNAASVGRKSYTADIYDKKDGWLAEATAETMAMAACLAIINYLEGIRVGKEATSSRKMGGKNIDLLA